MKFIKRTLTFILGTTINATTIWAMVTMPGTGWSNLATAWQWGIGLSGAFVFTMALLCVTAQHANWQATADKMIEQDGSEFWLFMSRLQRVFWIVLFVYFGFWGLAILRAYCAVVNGATLMTRKAQIEKEKAA